MVFDLRFRSIDFTVPNPHTPDIIVYRYSSPIISNFNTGASLIGKFGPAGRSTTKDAHPKILVIIKTRSSYIFGYSVISDGGSQVSRSKGNHI